MFRLTPAAPFRLGLTFLPLLLALPTVSLAGASDLRVAIYAGTGAESDKILAVFRATQAAGHLPLAVTKSDLVQGRLTTGEFDVFVIPSGEDGKRCCAGHYSDIDSLDQIATKNAIRAYLEAGGGVVALEAGASFASKNGGTLDIYDANYHETEPVPGKQTIEIVDPGFGAGTQVAWTSFGGGYFDLAPEATEVARDVAGNPVIVRAGYGAGRVVLSSLCLELRGDTELDWTVWDNWAMGGVHENSAGAWELLGRMIGWAYDGDSSAPATVALENPRGHRIAIVASHTNDGGAWPGLIPAVARSIEFAGHVPLAIRFDEIIDGRLQSDAFRVVTFPGGYSYGYKLGLAGHEQQIRDFVAAGGGYYGICAGSFYAPETIEWDGRSYDYPLGLYKGQDIGPIDDIVPWPDYTPTPLEISSDPVIGDLGVMNQMYYGGGYHTIPDPAVQGAEVHTSATFAYGGSAAGLAAVVRFSYGQGRVLMVTTHPESRAGSEEDWLYWDGFEADSSTPVTNPDNPWLFVDAAFNGWLSGPPPPLLCTDPPDGDGDGIGDHCDCAPEDPASHTLPGEVGSLQLAPDRVTLSWDSAVPDAGLGTVHDLVRGRLGDWPVGLGSEETCIEAGIGELGVDTEEPAAESGWWYLVRARNACGEGTCGAASDGTPRPGTVCP